MDVVVVGAGIVGAAVAHHLALAGASVTLLDAVGPGAGVTADSFAWIGAPGGGDPVDAGTALHSLALEDHRRLERDVPGVRVRWTGSLSWRADGALPPIADLAPAERLVSADEIIRLEPNLRDPPVRALLRAADGALDPVAVTRALVAAAGARGAVLHQGRPVTALRQVGGRVAGVDTTRGHLPADAVVLAAGTATPVLCAPLGTDLAVGSSPAVLLRLSGPPGLVRTVLDSPGVEVREAAPGRLLAALEHRGETGPEALRQSAEAFLARLRARFRGGEDVQLDDVRVGARPMPADGLPVVGSLPGHPEVYLAVMHAAVTLAPAVGRLVAAELVGGVPATELAGLRPARARPG